MASGDCSSPSPRKQMKLDTQFDQELGSMHEIIECQNEINLLNEQAAVEILDVERKFNQLRKPFTDNRGELIKKIPNFWFNAIQNHPHISPVLTENEQKCLEYLTNLEVEDMEDVESGYWIKFYFSENPFFENSILTKEFRLGNTDAFSTSTEINWKIDMDLTVRSDKSRIKTPVSFFDWFEDNSDPVEDRIANSIRDDIWANPLEYYDPYEDESSETSLEEEDEEENEEP